MYISTAASFHTQTKHNLNQLQNPAFQVLHRPTTLSLGLYQLVLSRPASVLNQQFLFYQHRHDMVNHILCPSMRTYNMRLRSITQPYHLTVLLRKEPPKLEGLHHLASVVCFPHSQELTIHLKPARETDGPFQLQAKTSPCSRYHSCPT